MPLARTPLPLYPNPHQRNPSHQFQRTTARFISGHSREIYRVNNLHRELAPISDAAWEQIEDEVSRTFKRYVAARRVVDMKGPAGLPLSAVGTGHLKSIPGSREGVLARQREVKSLVEL